MQDAALIYRFGKWQLDPLRRCLLAEGEPVPLNGRAFDMLVMLVTERNRVVSRDEIVSHVWAGLAVGDNNLTVQMSTLRIVLGRWDGEPLVVTVPVRGYQEPTGQATATERSHGIPPPPVEIHHDGTQPTIVCITFCIDVGSPDGSSQVDFSKPGDPAKKLTEIMELIKLTIKGTMPSSTM